MASPILLTGSDGYLGSRVAHALNAQGRLWKPLHGRLQALEPCSVHAECVIHCAGRLRQADPRCQQLWRDNLEATKTLIHALVPPAHVVFVSSRSVYPLVTAAHAEQGKQLALVEDAVVAPWDDYGASKWGAEQLLRQSECASTICRVPTLFGHPHRAGCFLDRALQAAVNGSVIVVAKPDRIEDALDVDRLAEALLLLTDPAQRPAPHQAKLWHIAGDHRPLGQILGALERVVSRHAIALETQSRSWPMPRTPLLDDRAFRSQFPTWRPREDDAVFAAMLATRASRAD